MAEPTRWTAPWPEPPRMPAPPRRVPAGRAPAPPPMAHTRYVTNLEDEPAYMPFRGQPFPPPPPPAPRRMNGPPPPPPGALAPGPRNLGPLPPPSGPPPSGPRHFGPPPPSAPPMSGPPQPRPLSPGPPPRALSPPNRSRVGPPMRDEDRYSWYPDIARSYEEESHYEPSINARDAKKDEEEEEFAKEAREEEPEKPSMTRWQRYQKHLRRRWYFYAAGLVISLAVGLPIMFLVILPAVIQKMVDSAPFPLIAVSLTSPGPNNFMLGMTSSLNIPGGIAVELDAANLSLAQMNPDGPGADFATVRLPSYQLKGNTTLQVPPQNVSIENHDAFINFIHTAALSESYQITTSGKSTVHLGALHANINIDKTMTVPGFNGFKGFSVPNAQLLLPPDADGNNIIGNATLPNPTVVTIELGDFEMNIMCGNIDLGTATVSGLTMKPGNTTVPLKGKVDIDALINNLAEILKLQEQGLQQGTIVFNSTMNSTTYNGVHIPDFEKAFEGVVLTASIPIMEVVGDSLQGFLSGNTTLSGVTQELAKIMNITDLSSLLGKGASSLLDDVA